MAFCNKVGSLMKQTVSQSGQVPALLNSFRCMSSSKLFIGGLSWNTNDDSLKDAFSSFGDVVSARVITDRDTGRSKGFGFVDFESQDSASEALSAMDGQELAGRNIRVSYATDRPPRNNGPRSYGNNNYGGNRGFGNEDY